MATPSINCFWKIRYKIIIGIMASSDPAIKTGKFVLNCPLKVAKPEESVIIFKSVFALAEYVYRWYGITKTAAQFQ